MADTQNGARASRFTAAILPWLVAGVGLLLYGFTLNHWASLHSLAVVSRICGWDWQPQAQRPLAFVVLYPFRFLPQMQVAPALNVFTALCAALVLALLARSVALWPQDRTRPQWLREKNEFGVLSISAAWLPPLVATLACGLQLTFWENATSASGEMLDLLMFAWTIRALLEHRISQKQSWLSSAAFFYAAGMADNWTLIVYLPALLAAMIWLKGLGFFELRFLARMSVWAAAGLCLYLVLPLFQSLTSNDHAAFWMTLKSNLKAQKNSLVYFPRGTFAALAFMTGLPLLGMSICWRGRSPNFGDDSLVGSFLAKGVFHFVHAVFLLFSFWLMLDSPFSPRKIGHGLPLLTQYYLASLVIGYCVGYFLLLGTVDVPKYVAMPMRLVLGLLFCAVPAALVWRNLDQITTTNGPVLRDFARQLDDGLPRGKSFVLCDEPELLLLLRAELPDRGGDKEPLLLDTHALLLGQYQRYLAGHFKSLWPFPPPDRGIALIEPVKAMDMVARLPGQGVYLHPSFSFYLERFREQPHQAVNYLFPRAIIGGASLDADSFALNERYWQNLWTNFLNGLGGDSRGRPASNPGLSTKVRRWLRLDPEQNLSVSFVSTEFSESLDYWAVCAQRAGHWDEAAAWFERAIALKPENLSARINLEFNERHRRGDAEPLDREMTQQQLFNYFARYHNWESAVRDNGPLDEPTFLFETAKLLLARGDRRQAAEAFARCAELSPGWREPNLWLAQALLNERDFAGALRVTEKVQAAGLPSDGSGLAQLLFCRATALRGLNRTNEAARCISDFVTRHPEQEEVLSIAARLYLQQMEYRPALGVFEQLLHHEPGKVEYLANKGLAEIQLSQYEAAIATLTSALTFAPSNRVARLDRAIAFLRAGRLDAAAEDYQDLLQAAPNSSKILFGLGEIAWRKRDTNSAIGFYEKCLTNNLPDAADRKVASERLRQLKGASAN